MNAILFFESEHATIEVYEKERLINLTWRGNVNGPTFRGPVEQLIVATKQFNLKYFLSDTREMGPILYADTEWSQRVVIPQLISGGLRRSAVLSSRDVLNKIAIDNMVASIPREAPYVVAYFGEVEEALNWLYKDEPIAVPVLHGVRT